MKSLSNRKGENRLLALLPKKDLDRITPKLQRLSLGLKDTLFERDQPIEHVFFPLGGVISLIAEMNDGARSEVGTVGNEGPGRNTCFFWS